MSTALDYVTVPEDLDTGATFWDQIEDLFNKFDDHTHNGIDSVLVNPSSSQSILAANWSSVTATGEYTQTIALPAGLSYNLVQISFIITSTGAKIYPTLVRGVDTSHYVVTVNDNTLALTAIYIN